MYCQYLLIRWQLITHGEPYVWDAVVAVCKNEGIKLLLPPAIYLGDRIMLPQGQRPAMSTTRRLGDVLDGGVEHEKLIRPMRGEVVLNILLGHPMRHKGAVGKGDIREGHGDGRDIASVGESA